MSLTKPQTDRNLQLWREWKAGDQRAFERLVEENIAFVKYIIFHHFNAFLPEHYDDMYQSGIEGLIQAINGWEPERAPLPTYASAKIRTYITNNLSLITQTLSGRIDAYRYTAIINQARAEIGENADYQEVTEHLRAQEDFKFRKTPQFKSIVKSTLKRIDTQSISLDAPVDELDNIHESIAAPGNDYQRLDDIDFARRAIRLLDKQDRQLLILWLGLGNDEPRNAPELALKLGRDSQVGYTETHALLEYIYGMLKKMELEIYPTEKWGEKSL